MSRDSAARLGVHGAQTSIEIDRTEILRLAEEGLSLDLNPEDVKGLVVKRSHRTAVLEPDDTKRSLGGDPNKKLDLTPAQLQELLKGAPTYKRYADSDVAPVPPPRRGQPSPTIDLSADGIQKLMATRDTTLDVELADVELLRVRKSAIAVNADTLEGPAWGPTDPDAP